MEAPRDIVAALDCVISLFFSDVRHRNRAAFILCDELIEMTCRAKAKAADPGLGRPDFPTLLGHVAVGLDPTPDGLGKMVNTTHRTRNDMQHSNAAATVDDPHCVDAILDAVRVMDHCYPGAPAALTDELKVMLRVLALHSSNGDKGKLRAFEDAMSKTRWGGPNPKIRVTEQPIPTGHRRYWGLVIHSEYATVEVLLNGVGAP